MFASKDSLLTRPSGGYNIARSVRLRSSASGYFNRTPASASNRKTFTWSSWIKRGALTSVQSFFTAAESGTSNPRTDWQLTSSDTLQIGFNPTGSAWSESITNAVFRDPSAWYHIVVSVDMTQATSTDRLKVYVNGIAQTFSSYAVPAQNTDLPVNNTWAHSIGRYQAGTIQYLDGYLTEINFIDGQALTPSSFGETDSITGVWKPKAYSGTYGTNGFELNFSDNSASTAATIGKDYSGNGNNWTPNNISVTAGVTYDSMQDVPTLTSATAANYATLNPLAVGSSGTLSDGSLKIAGLNSSNVGASYSTIGMTTGKWYFEVTAVGVGSNFSYALVEDVVDTSALNVSGSIFAGYRSTGDTYGTVSITTTTWNTANVVIGVAVDCDNGAVYFANANTWINSGVPTSGASRTGAITTYTGGTKTLHGGVGCFQDSSQSAAINFGQRPFSYTPPTGFVALNTFNLPASTITNGAAYMAATTYTGNGGTLAVSNAVNGVSFQPDWVWIKMRSGAAGNELFDSVRGANIVLYSNATNAESNSGTMSTFGSGGFTAVYQAGDVSTNNSGSTFVGWQWKAGTTSASNTNGSITSTVSVGATQGFSVVTYTGNGSSSATVGHGLGVVPSMIINKTRSGTVSWFVKHTSLASNLMLTLDTTDGTYNGSLAGGGGLGNLTSSTTFGFVNGTSNVNNVNASGSTYVAYCFAAVAGYSAFGSYTGNASADGTFVYLGFRPRFVLMKYTSAGGDWYMYDSTRSPINVSTAALVSNSSAAEISQGGIDFLSNGFKLRASNNPNVAATYIYMAFAESPFRNALAR